MKPLMNIRGMTRRMLVLLCLLAIGTQGCAQEGRSQQPGQSFVPLKTAVKTDALIARLETFIPQLMAEGVVPGLSIVLIREGKVFWQRGFGVKSTQTKEPVDESTVFEAASLSKPVFAYGVLKLVDDGKLNLDTPLTKYLPGAYVQGDARLNRITARMVLSHTTGFPNWRPRGGALKIHFTPGERFSYSGEGFVYLQKVVERLTGTGLDEFMQKTVFGPLGMQSSSYVWRADYEARKVFGHDPFGSVTGRRKPSEANAAASLHTTPQDYAKFVIAVMKGTGLKVETARLMLTERIKVREGCQDCISNPSTGGLSATVGWGLGWGLQTTPDGESFWHWGDSNNDAQAYVVGFPKQGLALAVFTNSGNGHSIIPLLINEALGGRQPAIAWLNYDPYNSPLRTLVKDILTRGGAAIAEYRERRKTAPPSARLNEAQVNRVGYALLSKKMIDEAIEILKLNVEDFPRSWNVYDSLAEAYMLKGENRLAIENYRKSIELNPDNAGGKEALKKLQGN
ncbi:MAG TPA: serine hydrolase [Pyrinomonadaceae bacterium]|jgi:CubicO group peptidase (beta-lactamase class C family)